MSSQSNVISKAVDAGGSPLILFHGTTKDFDRFRRGGHRRNQQLAFGIHFAEDRAFAELYAQGQNGRIIEASLDVRRLLDTTRLIREGSEDWQAVAALFRRTQHKPYVSDGLTHLSLDIFDPARAERILRDLGYDGVRYEAKYGTHTPYGARFSAKSPSWVVFEPDQILPPGTMPVPSAVDEDAEEDLSVVPGMRF